MFGTSNSIHPATGDWRIWLVWGIVVITPHLLEFLKSNSEMGKKKNGRKLDRPRKRRAPGAPD